MSCRSHYQRLRLAAFMSLASLSPAWAGLLTSNDANSYVPGEILVQWRSGATALDQSRVGSTLGTFQTLRHRHDLSHFKLGSTLSVEEGLRRARLDPAVAWAQPNFIYHAHICSAPTSLTDPYFTSATLTRSCGTNLVDPNWPFTQINAPQAWAVLPFACPPSQTVTVAVLDTGISSSVSVTNHPDLPSSMFVRGFNEITPAADTIDDFGHGTWVAGIIAAQWNNAGGTNNCPTGAPAGPFNGGMAGVAGYPGLVKLMPVKVLDNTGSGTTAEVISGTAFAVANGARILNFSLGATASDPLEQQAIESAISAGCVVIASAGNDSTTRRQHALDFPAGYPGVISVGATTTGKTVAFYSNGGTGLSLVAPGGAANAGLDAANNIYGCMLNCPSQASTVDFTFDPCDKNYGSASGTSASAPFVTGAAALLLAENPSLNNGDVASILTKTATDLGPAGWDAGFGWGLLNLQAALSAAATWVSTPGTSTPTPTTTLTPTNTRTPAGTRTPTRTATNSPTKTATNTPTTTPNNTTATTPTNTATNTPTNSQTNTPSPTPTPSFTNTSTLTETSTPSATASPSPTNTFTSTGTKTPTNTLTNSPTSTPSATPTNSPTPSPTSTPTATPSNTPSATASPSPTNTSTSTGTDSPTATASPSPTNTPSSTPSDTPTNSPTNTPTKTPTNTLTSSPTATATKTPTNSPTNTPSNSPSNTPTNTLTDTPSPTPSSTPTYTPTSTTTNSPSNTPSDTPSATASLSPTNTFTQTMTSTPSNTPTRTPTNSPTATSTSTPTDTSSATASPTLTPTMTSTSTASPSPTNSATSTGTSTPTNTATPSSTSSFTATFTPSFTFTPSNTSTATPTRTPTNTATDSPTSTYTATFTPSFTFTPSNTWTHTPTNTPTASLTPSPTFTLSNVPTSSTPTFTPTPTFTTSNNQTFTQTNTLTLTATPFVFPDFTLSPAYPNPTHGDPIKWNVQAVGSWTVNLSVFTSGIRKIRQENLTVNANTTLVWDLRDNQENIVANGVYFVRIKAVRGAQTITKIFKVIVAL